jgi:hypothetical protein
MEAANQRSGTPSSQEMVTTVHACGSATDTPRSTASAKPEYPQSVLGEQIPFPHAHNRIASPAWSPHGNLASSNSTEVRPSNPDHEVSDSLRKDGQTRTQASTTSESFSVNLRNRDNEENLEYHSASSSSSLPFKCRGLSGPERTSVFGSSSATADASTTSTGEVHRLPVGSLMGSGGPFSLLSTSWSAGDLTPPSPQSFTPRWQHWLTRHVRLGVLRHWESVSRLETLVTLGLPLSKHGMMELSTRILKTVHACARGRRFQRNVAGCMWERMKHMRALCCCMKKSCKMFIPQVLSTIRPTGEHGTPSCTHNHGGRVEGTSVWLGCKSIPTLSPVEMRRSAMRFCGRR